jgi:hypothetical protein
VLSAGNGSETRLFFQLGGLAALRVAGPKLQWIENRLRERTGVSPALDGVVWPSARREARSTQELLGTLWSSKGCCVGKAAG